MFTVQRLVNGRHYTNTKGTQLSYFASRTRAIAPETSGQAALVPSNSSLQPPSAVVVICTKSCIEFLLTSSYPTYHIHKLYNVIGFTAYTSKLTTLTLSLA